MEKTRILFVAMTLALGCGVAQGQVADSVDAVDYDISLDLSGNNLLRGYANVTLSLLHPCQSVGLRLLGTVDSVRVDGMMLSAGSGLETLPTAGKGVGEPFHVEVWYHTGSNVESGGWGGFHFESTQSYNLGVGFNADPHVMGRAMFPCRDNFTDKATYTLRVTTRAGWTAECGGVRQSVAVDSLGREHSVWRIGLPTPTYLVSASQAAWVRIHDTVESIYGSYPLTIGYRQRVEANVRSAFAELDSVVPMYERCFGPYRWGRIGYIATSKGSMEHVNNIALDHAFIASTSERAQSTIAHELGHAWFGNLLTCEEEGDMWINEGGASFCSEVAMEAVRGRRASDDYYQRNLEQVLRTTHLTDGSYRALHGMPHSITYGSTTYDKGWMVWHSLRGYLGEDRFYSALRTLMERCAFGNIDAYRLRDSLSLYSGVDLTDFFDFHVFSPGFVDYHAELVAEEDGTAVIVGVQGVGTTQPPASHRVPLTFYAYSADGVLDSVTRWVAFDGQEARIAATELTLPFAPLFCMVDAGHELSDAATVAMYHNRGYEDLLTKDLVHLRLRSQSEFDIRVEHHMAPAPGVMPEGVVRRSGRYWMVRGAWSTADSVELGFRYVRTGDASNLYANLDRGFYNRAATLDSLGLFYRCGNGCPWTLVSRQRSGEANSGWLMGEALLPGEYTLAVVDFENLGICNPAVASGQLFPNPLVQGQPLTVEAATDEPFTVTIVDTGGRQVWQKTACHNGQPLHPALPKGTYFVRIENNFISLQSKLIVIN